MLTIWNEFLKLAKQEVGSQIVETWFKCVSIESVCPRTNTVVLVAPNQFVANWITRNYLLLFRSGLARLFGFDEVKILFGHSQVHVVDKSPVVHTPELPSEQADTKVVPAKKTGDLLVETLDLNQSLSEREKALALKKELAIKKIGICSKYRFDTFIVGAHNHLAYSASVAITKGATRGYNPLFIYGPTGLGKTHLLNCIGNEMRELRPNAKIVYKTSDKFVDEFIKSIRFDKIDHFKEKYCTTDLLLIDDIQFLSQKEQTQEMFFHIFNNMHQNNKQIVLSSDLPPNKITGLQERLKSRFGWGLIADIQPPGFETRIAILLKKAEIMKISLSHAIAAKIAAKVNSNIRELEGTLTRLATLSMLGGQPISEQLVDQELNSPVALQNTQNICPESLLRNVARLFNVNLQDLKSDKREKNMAYARQVAMYILREKTNYSLKTIGQFLGGKNHATVLYAIETIAEKIKQDSVLAQKIQNLLDNNGIIGEQYSSKGVE